MTTASSYVIDFGAQDGELIQSEAPAYKARTCPQTIIVGQAFRIIVQGPSGYFIRWPYTSTIIEQTAVDEAYSEHFDLSGSDIVETYAPVKSLTSLTAINQLVDGQPAGYGNPGGDISAVIYLGKIKLQNPLWGTVRAEYVTHTQSWQCNGGLPNPGQYVFQVVYQVQIMKNGIPTGSYKEVSSMVTFTVSGDTGTDSGRTDFCSDLGGGPA